MKPETAKNAPLSSATLHILLALAGGNLHGYGIIKEVARNSDGHYRLGPGTLYDNLKKLIDSGLVADVPTTTSTRRATATKEDDRRFTPWTEYPLANNSSAKYAPSCPVIPVIKAVFSST